LGQNLRTPIQLAFDVNVDRSTKERPAEEPFKEIHDQARLKLDKERARQKQQFDKTAHDPIPHRVGDIDADQEGKRPSRLQVQQVRPPLDGSLRDRQMRSANVALFASSVVSPVADHQTVNVKQHEAVLSTHPKASLTTLTDAEPLCR
jgi:hypothetical protein